MSSLIMLQHENEIIKICKIDKEDFPFGAIKIIAQVLADNKGKYPVGNWKKVPIEEHLDHAEKHLFHYNFCNENKINENDTEEPHLHHALTRLAMAAELEMKMKK